MPDWWISPQKALKPLTSFVDSISRLCSVFIRNWAAATKGIGAFCILIYALTSTVQAIRLNVGFWEVLGAMLIFTVMFVLMVRLFGPVDKVASS